MNDYFDLLADKLSKPMDKDFWERRERDIEVDMIRQIIDYCDIYSIIHNEEFDVETVKSKLTALIAKTLEFYLSDNDN